MSEQRKRFDAEVIDAVMDVGDSLLAKVPELEMLVIVPVWNIPQEQLHAALFKTRDGRSQTPTQVMLCLDRLLKATAFQFQRLHDLLGAAQEMSRTIAGEINERQQQLEKLRTQTAAAAPGAQSAAATVEP